MEPSKLWWYETPEILFLFLPIQEFLHSGNMTEGGPLDQIDDHDNEDEESICLPGVLKGKDDEEVLEMIIYGNDHVAV